MSPTVRENQEIRELIVKKTRGATDSEGLFILVDIEEVDAGIRNDRYALPCRWCNEFN